MKAQLAKKTIYIVTMLMLGAAACTKLETAKTDEAVFAKGSDADAALAAGDPVIPSPAITQPMIDNFNTAHPSDKIVHLKISDDYTVEVKASNSSDDAYKPVVVFKTDNYSTGTGSKKRKQESASFANFGYGTSSIVVRITTLGGTTIGSSSKIKPTSYGLTPAPVTGSGGKKVTYQISSGSSRRIAFTNSNDPLNPLFVFCNPPEPAVPSSVTYEYFAGSIQNIKDLKVKSNDVVYIHAGAIVQGNFIVPNGVNNVKFLGQGIFTSGNIAYVDGSDPSVGYKKSFTNSPFAGDVAFGNKVTNITWQGLTIINSPSWVFSCVYGLGGTDGTTHLSNHNTMKDLKEIHWNPQTDPIWFDGDDNTVSDCFLFAFDDITSHGSNRCTLSNLVVWQGGNGGHLLMLDNNSSSDAITYDGVDLIDQDNVQQTVQLKADVAGKTVSFTNITMKNIRVEDRSVAQSGTGFFKNRFFDMTPATGSGKYNVTNFTFQNVTLKAKQPGTDGEGQLNPDGTATGVLFKTFKLGGIVADDFSDLGMSKNARVSTTVTP